MNRLSTGAAVLWDALPYMQGIVTLRNEIKMARTLPSDSNQPSVPAAWHRIVFKDVFYRYPSADEPILCGIDLALERGKSYGIVGPSGGGKSTLVDVLAGLLIPHRGRVTIDGTPLSALSVASWRAQIGYVSQAPFMLNGSLRANVAFGVQPDKIDDVLIWECLRQAHLEDIALKLEHGLDTELGDRGLRLSGGQRQRIAIARALYKQPQLLILDEATSALDGISEQAIRMAIMELHGRITVVTVAHRLTAIREYNQIILLTGGRLTAQGTYEELLTTSPLFRDLASLSHTNTTS